MNTMTTTTIYIEAPRITTEDSARSIPAEMTLSLVGLPSANQVEHPQEMTTAAGLPVPLRGSQSQYGSSLVK